MVVIWISSSWAATNVVYGTVSLAWNPSPDSTVTGYRIYFGPSSGVYTNSIAFGRVTNETVRNLTIGSTYYFAAVAFNGVGLESPFSNEVSYKVSSSKKQIKIKISQ